MKKARQLVIGIMFAVSASACLAQAVGVTRAEVLRADLGEPGSEAVVSRVDVQPGGKLGWHTHPGDEIAYVESGVITVLAAGKPAREVGAGDSFVVPTGAIHGVRNDHDVPVRLVTVHVVRKNQPLATPASAPAATAE